MLRAFVLGLLAVGLQVSPAAAAEAYERPLYCGALFKALPSEGRSSELAKRWAANFTEAGIKLMVKGGIDASGRKRILAETEKRVARDMTRNYSLYTFEDCTTDMKRVPIPYSGG